MNPDLWRALPDHQLWYLFDYCCFKYYLSPPTTILSCNERDKTIKGMLMVQIHGTE